MTDRELMQMALHWADEHLRVIYGMGGATTVSRMTEWTAAFRARLAQPEQEPVALGDSSYDVDFRDDGTISVSLPDGDELVIVPPQPKQKDLEPYCYTWDKWISSGTWEAQYGWKPYYGGKRPEHVTDAKPLYTAPPQREWIGLTDEEIMDACSAVWASHPIEVGQVVAAILKEKNGF